MQFKDGITETAKHTLDLVIAAFFEGYATDALADTLKLCRFSGDVFKGKIDAALKTT